MIGKGRQSPTHGAFLLDDKDHEARNVLADKQEQEYPHCIGLYFGAPKCDKCHYETGCKTKSWCRTD